MSEHKHTPGPWTWTFGGKYIYGADGFTVANVRRHGNSHLAEEDANAEFIVRACNSHYDLLEACEAVLDALSGTDLGGAIPWIRPPYQAAGVHETASERLAAAIAKAKGEES